MINEKEVNELRKNILFICDHSMDLVGGSQESLRVVMDGLKDEYEITLYTPGKGKYLDKKVRHYHCSRYDSMKTMIKHPFSFFHYYMTLLKLIKNNNYKIIHTQEQVGYFAVALMKRLGLINRKVVLIHTERGLQEKYGFLFKAIFYSSLGATNALVTTTKYNHGAWNRVIKKKLHNKKTKCILIENTAGQRFEVYDESKRKKKKETITLGFAGRYCSWKGWELVVRICNKIKDLQNVNVEIVLGCLTEHDLKEGRKIEKRILEILGDRFKCHFNYDIAQMDEFYYNIDLFLLTSDPHSESFGRVLVEAMSRYVAVLGTDCGGATEVLGDEGRICNTEKEFYEKIKYYAENQEMLKEEQHRCYERYISNYSVKNNVRKHRLLYKKFCLEE